MLTLHSNFTCLSMCLLYLVCSVFSFPVETNLIEQTLLQSIDTSMTHGSGKDNTDENSTSSSNTRVKRSKTFKEAGETSQLKVIQQLAQLIRNFWAKKPIGGRHPFDPTVPFIFGKLVKKKFFSMLDSEP